MIFIWILSYLFLIISNISMGYGSSNYQQSAGFFEEPRNSLDAVYIGASPTFTSWVAPLAWHKYGIAVRTFANNSQPFVVVKDFLQLARKKQPNAIYMIAINGIYNAQGLDIGDLHASTDYFQPSMEKIRLINGLCEAFQCTLAEKIELFFPLVRYHSRWTSLNKQSFHDNFEPYKGGFVDEGFLNLFDDISGYYYETIERKALPEFTRQALAELLDYCKTEQIQVVFILSAQYRGEGTLKWYNTIIDEINTYGFPLINEIADFDEIGLDDTIDFYNANHANIHGAIKITDYLAQYLIDNYDFEDKRGGIVYTDWDEAYEKYIEIVRPYLTEEELEWLQ